MQYLKKIFSSDFMPHGHCYFWKSEIVWTNAISDAIIALAYLTIPFTLVYIVRLRKDINYVSMLILFAIFILGCGATHVMDVINIWKPYYYLDSSLRVLTAIASIGTALVLIKITPRIILIPNPEVFKQVNENLQTQIIELEEKERLLREREALLIETQEITNIGSYALNLQTFEYHWSPQLFKIFGYDLNEEISKDKIYSRIHPDDRDKLSESIEKAYKMTGNIDLDYRLLLPDGSIKYTWSKGVIEFDEKGVAQRLVGTVLDQTEREMAKEKLNAVQFELSEVKEFVFLAESVPQLVWTAYPNGKVQYFNDRFYQYTGQTKIDMKEWGWTAVLHEEDFDRTVAVWTKALNENELYQIEYRLRRFDGAYRWFLGKGTPMKDETGKVLKWFGTCTDIDDIKRSEEELKRKNEELSKTNRDLDNFVYIASHDLKAPVANLEGLLTVHRKKVQTKLSQEEIKIIDLMDLSIMRFSNTIKELTEISKIGKNLQEDTELVFFNETLADVQADLQSELQDSGVMFSQNFLVPDIYHSKKNFKSIIYNLVSNAIKYRRQNVVATVRLTTYKYENYTVLTVEDNGVGFDISKKDIAFSMFRRLHNHVEGSGMGLYIVKRIVEDTGGKIEVESQVGKGTLFRVYFL